MSSFLSNFSEFFSFFVQKLSDVGNSDRIVLGSIRLCDIKHCDLSETMVPLIPVTSLSFVS